MIVVSNASPLITLARAELLYVVPSLFESLFISPQVQQEIAERNRAGAEAFHSSAWLNVVSLNNPTELAEFVSRTGLGLGELSTILLAQQLNADAAIIDERRARTLAATKSIGLLGTIGLLELCFKKGSVQDLRKAYLQLLEAGMYVTPEILNQSLQSFELRPI